MSTLASRSNPEPRIQNPGRVLIIGGGISGLAAAYDLQNAGVKVTLLEASDRLGGKVGSVRQDGLLIETGPDAIFTAKPWANQLMSELGMQDEIMAPITSEFSIYHGGKLHTVPRAFAQLMPSAAGALEQVAFFAASAKRRILREKEVKSGDGQDESIASFFRRRFGRKFSSLIAEPMLAGVHAGDPEKLSMRALYPSYLGMEKEHGSISAAGEKRAAAATGSNHKVGFMALRNGMGSFVDRLVAALGEVDIRLNTKAIRLEFASNGVRADLGDEAIEADLVILAVPAYIAANLLRGAPAPVSERRGQGEEVPEAPATLLSQIPFVSTAVVALTYPHAALPKVHGSGFLVPFEEPCDISGCTWSSNKWENRAPDDVLLARVFMGRSGGFNVDAHTDDRLAEIAAQTLSRIIGTSVDPRVIRVDRWTNAMAQYELGHLDRLAQIEASLAGLPITLIGASYRGNSVPDCVKQGRESATRLLSLAQS